MPIAQKTPAVTRIQIDWPELPALEIDFATKTVRREPLDRFYFDLQTSFIRELESLAKLIDSKADKA